MHVQIEHVNCLPMLLWWLCVCACTYTYIYIYIYIYISGRPDAYARSRMTSDELHVRSHRIIHVTPINMRMQHQKCTYVPAVLHRRQLRDLLLARSRTRCTPTHIRIHTHRYIHKKNTYVFAALYGKQSRDLPIDYICIHTYTYIHKKIMHVFAALYGKQSRLWADLTTQQYHENNTIIS